MLPCGTLNKSYKQDIAIFRTRAQWGMLIAFLVLLFSAPLYCNNYILSVIVTMTIMVILVQGLNILTGYCGQISLGQAAFYGVGAYISGILTVRLGLPWLAAFICAMLGTGLIGMIFGLPALRIKGLYLAMATLAAQLLLCWCFLHLESWTGGSRGMVVANPSIGGLVFASKTSKYYLIVTIALLMLYFAKNIVRTRVGRAFIAIRDNDLAASVMGINLWAYKLLAFFICCAFAGAAGSLWAHYLKIISPDMFLLTDSILYLGMLIVGGMGSIMGGIFGVVFLWLLRELAIVVSPILAEIFPALGGSTFAGLVMLFYAIIIMLFLTFEPRGLNHRWLIFKNSYRLFPFAY